ncbi:MAG: hypothetical protein HYZ53_27645 [Planctomycetes bacterium]|nr:hypothetical protein [Planctomycetota bacterium]
MGRIFDSIHVGKERLYTLFDTGAKNSFISARAAAAGQVAELAGRQVAEIGGKRHRLRQGCFLEGTLRKRHVVVRAFVLPEIGVDGDGRPIDVIFGADDMQNYGIRLIPKEELLDLSHFQRSFVEF